MLRLEVLVVDGKWYSTEYSLFYLESEAVGNYSLHVNGNWGDMGDVFNLGILSDRQNGMTFTTKDADHDLFGAANCAILKGGGFWYNACYHFNVNGQYLGETQGYLNNDNYVSTFSVTRMMIKLVKWPDLAFHNRSTLNQVNGPMVRTIISTLFIYLFI